MGYLDRSSRGKNRGRETSVLQTSPKLKHSHSASSGSAITHNNKNYNYREQPPLDLPAIPALVPTNFRDRPKPRRSRVVSVMSRTPMKMASAPISRSRNHFVAGSGGNTGSDAGVFLYVQVRVHNVIQRLLVPRMLAQVKVCDRSFLLRKYRRCFVGNDAVAWLISRRFARTIREAEALGNALLQAGVFRHVRNEHRFRAGNYFYRFAAHENYATSDDDSNNPDGMAGLRSSRLMSVATRNTPAQYRDTTFSEDDFSVVTRIDSGPTDSYNSNRASSSSSGEDRLSFTEKNVAVDIGIRIGSRMYPDLVSRFSQAVEGIGKFTGGHAVDWLIAQAYIGSDNIDDAMAVGNAMIKAGVFFPVVNGTIPTAGFDLDRYYRLSVDVDFSAELKRGELKDNILKMFGIDRSKGTDSLEETNAPWFEDSLSFTTNSSYGY